MSSVEREREIEKHKLKVAEEKEAIEAAQARGEMYFPSKVHMRIEEHLNVIETQQSIENKRKRIHRDVSEVSSISDQAKVYFWDYNTVELVLLGCAIFVCISGVMFQSSRSDSRTDLTSHLEALAVIAMMVIIGSLAYYTIVFMSEVFTTFGWDKSAWVLWLMNVRDERKLEKKEDDDDFEMAAVSVQQVKLERDKKKELQEEQAMQQLRELQEENEKLLRQLADLKKQNKAMELQDFGKRGGSTKKQRAPRANKRNKKKMTDSSMGDIEMEEKKQDASAEEKA